jgi:hypothetical protein
VRPTPDRAEVDAPPPQPFAGLVVGTLIATKLALHLTVLAVTQFGIHRDEFLYLAMGRHLRFWRMDFPPLIESAPVPWSSRSVKTAPTSRKHTITCDQRE